MFTKNGFDNRAAFEEKYALYGDMLYRLGIVYFGPEKDDLCKEAMEEAFLWLLKRKKDFKDSDEERLELLKHMVLICESKSGRKPKLAPQMEGETSPDDSFSESMDMLEAVYGLPNKYKPVLHLAFYKDMDVNHISKILSIPKSIIKKLLTKGIELMEMVMERKLDRDYYCRMVNEHNVPSNIREDVYSCITEGKPHVKTYLSPVQKAKAVLAAIAIAALSSN